MITLRSAIGLLVPTYLMTCLAAQAAPMPNYGSVSVNVPFVNAAALSDAAQYVSPQIRIGFAGAHAVDPTFSVTMDTGSVGIFAGINYFVPPPDGRNDPSFVGPGTETLTSSGVVIAGDWYKTEVDLYNGATIVASATVPVLSVTGVSCIPDARDCKVTDSSGANTHYFGVGFAGGAGQPQGTPDKNAFLNITNVVGSEALPSPGYILTRAGAQIGLTSANAQGFALIKLEPVLAPNSTQWQVPPANPDLLTDWQHTRGTITVNGKSGQGTILFDTGVTTGFLTPPLAATPSTGTGPDGAECNGSSPPACAVTGTQVGVAFPQASSPIASLNYTVGPGNGPQTGNPISPRAVAIVPNAAPFLNTTVRFLQAFDYMYDAGNGFTGLKTSGATPAKFATAKPMSLSVTGTYKCFFKSAAPALGFPPERLRPMAYSWPFTYRMDARRQVALGISSGSAAVGDMPATKANDVYVLANGRQPTNLGPLQGWLAAAGCQ